MKASFATIILSLAILPLFASAQGAQFNILADSGTTMSVFPEMPGPNQEVTARLDSSSVDLDISKITWFLNGKSQKSGKGVRDFSFSTGDIGSRVLIVATIESEKGKMTKVYDFTVGSIDLIWEGGGYVPPFYDGRSLWGRQGQLRLLAIPNVSGNPSSLIYKWSIEGQVLGNSSGVGKNSLSLYDTILSLPKKIEVSVWQDQNTELAENSITLNPTSPLVYTYEDSPLYGFLFNRAVTGSYLMSDKEITLTAFPFFFSTDSRLSPGVTYSWKSNAGVAGNTNSVTYRAPDSKGSSSINIGVRSVNNLLQTAEGRFLVKFGEQ